VWIAPGVPEWLRVPLNPLLDSSRYTAAAGPDGTDLAMTVSMAVAPISAEWVYAVTAPFPTLADEVAWDDVIRYWSGDSSALSYVSNDGGAPSLYLSEDVLATLSAWIGAPDDAVPLHVVPADAVHQAAWEAGSAWSIVPFHRLRPEWKVLRVDEWDLLDPNADLAGYPLAVCVGIQGSDAAIDAMASDLAQFSTWQSTNREPARMTVLAMTGVTALTRLTAYKMDLNGVLYPAQDIAPLLQSADILHVSNEVAFTENCPPATNDWGIMRFCSNDAYFELLTHIGVDVVELTGNHVNDWGTEALDESLDLYEAAGMGVFGGGRNLEAAQMPYITTHNGNSIAFVGCNPVGPASAYAAADSPGAASCDYNTLYQQITDLAGQVDIVVATQQYREFDQAEPTAQQAEDFANLARAGAVIVSGSQAHTPQGFAFVDDKFVHYGLGNLFFDQMQALNLREHFVDLHVIYDGRHISTALWTGIIEDYAQPREMTDAERRSFLTRIFAASGW
jgi:poly-gamma-glutamate synthesis protein (capsule biosynthesis protein)